MGMINEQIRKIQLARIQHKDERGLARLKMEAASVLYVRRALPVPVDLEAWIWS